jgi:hypothetical protein
MRHFRLRESLVDASHFQEQGTNGHHHLPFVILAGGVLAVFGGGAEKSLEYVDHRLSSGVEGHAIEYMSEKSTIKV